MATGYTIEVLNGNINTLEDFAKICAKGFGATAHQKEEPLNTPLRPAEVSKTHKKAIRQLKKQLKEFNDMSDEQIHKDQEKALKDARLRYLDKIVQIKDAKKKLNKLLLDAQLWEPPTEKHNVVKKFMIDELKNTIGYDCDLKPVNELIEDIEGRLASIDVEKIREDQVRAFNQQIEFHEQSYKVDKEHVGQSNEWVNQLVKSFEKTKLNIVK